MLNHGVPVIIISLRLGHAKPSITLDIYGHLIPGMQEEAAQLIDELITAILIQQLHPTAPDLHPILPIEGPDPISRLNYQKTPTGGGIEVGGIGLEPTTSSV